MADEPFVMQFDIGTIKHLGIQMYSTLPPVIAELVANSWDGDATNVYIIIPTGQITEASELTVVDDGVGMSDNDIRNAYLVVGRDRREVEGDKPTEKQRRIMGRKGIGKFSAFGVANEMEIESAKDGAVSRLKMNYKDLKSVADKREIIIPPLAATGNVTKGTKVTLRDFTKYKSNAINIQAVRRGLARRFSVIGAERDFHVFVNDKEIEAQERDLQRLLEKDTDNQPYIWKFDEVEVKEGTGWKVSGWIGALDHTRQIEDGIQRGIVIMARGKMVQEPFVFDALVGQQFALSYLVGELNAEFVDMAEDTVATTRNTLVWDTDVNTAFKEWGKREVNRIAREWADKRSSDNERELEKNTTYQKFRDEATKTGNKRALRLIDKLVKNIVAKNPLATVEEQERVAQIAIDFLEFDAFWELAEQMLEADLHETGRLVDLFREWEVVEAKEMARVTQGRIATIQRLQELIEHNALEVPALHSFLKEFPWVLDPRWTLVDDEVWFSELLRKEFPDDDLLEGDRRIDFLCVSEGNSLVVVEIKRPQSKASMTELGQIEKYVSFITNFVRKTTDPSYKFSNVVGYLLCGTLVNTYDVEFRIGALEKAGIYVRKYSDLLRLVEKSHREFLERYERLRAAKTVTASAPQESE